MSMLATPLVANEHALVVRLNPVTKLAAAFCAMVTLLLTIDPLTPAMVLAAELLVVFASGIRWRVLLRRAWPLFAGIGGLTLTTLLFTEDRTGAPVFELGSWQVTTGSVLAAVAIGLRVLAIALPGILAFATTDPTEFADALVQHLRAPARFTFGALAAFRLFPLLGDEWHTLVAARRARGVDPGRSPIRRVRMLASVVFALLVAAIRRGIRLATAMEARGFGTADGRTLARPKGFTGIDYACLVGTVFVLVAITYVGIRLGTWRPAFF